MKLHYYRGFGLLIRSEFELPELPPAAAANELCDVEIRRGCVARVSRKITIDDELVLQNPAAAFHIRGGREVIVEEYPGTDPGTLRVMLLGRVMAFLFRQRGWLPLHASGVVINGTCALFLGHRRAGKSTTAAAFHSLGHLVVTDDVAPVRVESSGRCILQSAWSHVRLRSETLAVLSDTAFPMSFQAGKHRFDLSAPVAGDLYPVGCAYAIEFGEEMRAEQVDKLHAIPVLSRCSFVKHRQLTREALERHLADCSAVARAIPVRRLIRPRSLGTLPELVRFVENDLAASGNLAIGSQAPPSAPAAPGR